MFIQMLDLDSLARWQFRCFLVTFKYNIKTGSTKTFIWIQQLHKPVNDLTIDK